MRQYAKNLEPADLAQVEAWVREAHGWAYVDPLAGDVAGPVALRHASAWPLIDAWAGDEDFWVRRSAYTRDNPGGKARSARVKDAIQRSFRLISANLRRHLPVHLTYR